MIQLRELKEKDATLMLEWMHDEQIQKFFQKDMMKITLEDTLEFCKNSVISNILKENSNMHFAIVNDTDEYLGTISLKNISWKNGTAEFAISTRKKSHGKGYAKIATKMLLNKAFYEYGLQRIYLNVLSDNAAAIRLYEHSGFKCEGEWRNHLFLRNNYVSLKWYAILKDEFIL